MVNLQAIADRAGVSREAVRLWATGKRGPGRFPRPVIVTADGEQIWDWEQVAPAAAHTAPSRRARTAPSAEVGRETSCSQCTQGDGKEGFRAADSKWPFRGAAR